MSLPLYQVGLCGSVTKIKPRRKYFCIVRTLLTTPIKPHLMLKQYSLVNFCKFKIQNICYFILGFVNFKF